MNEAAKAFTMQETASEDRTAMARRTGNLQIVDGSEIVLPKSNAKRETLNAKRKSKAGAEREDDGGPKGEPKGRVEDGTKEESQPNCKRCAALKPIGRSVLPPCLAFSVQRLALLLNHSDNATANTMFLLIPRKSGSISQLSPRLCAPSQGVLPVPMAGMPARRATLV